MKECKCPGRRRGERFLQDTGPRLLFPHGTAGLALGFPPHLAVGVMLDPAILLGLMGGTRVLLAGCLHPIAAGRNGGGAVLES